MSLVPGGRLGPHEITAKLGEGGMGEVWRATDTRLRREVAIKVLPAAFVADPERLARFEREAQLLAQLHHPHIASIFGLEDSNGTRALVMELVEGEELSTRIARAPIAVEEAIAIARQIADALEAAHDKGIVHRDLKPQNVKIAPDGTVKVLDFGLAKAMDAAAGATPSAADLARSPTLMNSPTVTSAALAGGTQLGVILGTAGYMAPEQARGGAVDKRADIWAFGVVLYEMLVGRSLFAAETVSDTLAGVLKSEVDFTRLPAATPPAVRGLLRRCLERNPKNRLHDIADARIVLDEVIAGHPGDSIASGASAAPASRRTRLWPLAAGIAAGLLVGGLAARWLPGSAPPAAVPQLARFEITNPKDASFTSGLSVAPDGGAIAFVARDATGRTALWLRTFDVATPRRLDGTEDALLPFWAPDSRRIGFFSQRGLRWVDIRGGAPVEVAATSGAQDVRGAAWGADEVIVYAPSYSGALYAVPAAGGPSTPATRLPADGSVGTTRFPNFLPDGKRFVFFGSPGAGTEPGTLFLGRIGSLEAKRLGAANSSAVWAPPGYLLYSRGDTLVAHRFDDVRDELVGDAVPLGLATGGSVSVAGLRALGVSRSGLLALRADTRSATQLAWFGRDGKLLEPISDAGSVWHYAPRLSPDGRSLLVSQYASGGKLGEIWVHDLARRIASRFTFDGADDYVSLWSKPDGEEIFFNSARSGPAGGIYRARLDQPGDTRRWQGGGVSSVPVAMTPDGRRVVFEMPDAQGRTGLWIRDVEGDSEPQRLSMENASESGGDISSDGRWLAYVSDATRSVEIYARRLDGSGGTVRISNEGGSQPVWGRNGRELFYLDAQGRIVAVPVTLGESLVTGAPQALFMAGLEGATDRQYDVSGDGQRFLLNRSLAVENVPIGIVLDWRALLRREEK